MIRRHRVVLLASLASVAVVALFWVAGTRFELFGSSLPAPITPEPTETILVYSSRGELFVMSGLDEEPVNITNTAEEELNPAISPDGRSVVFERVEGSDSATSWGLHSMPVAGGESMRLTSGDREVGFDREPTWSPGGGRIVFVRHLASGSEILGTDTALVVMDADGSDQQEVTERPGAALDPAWSFDARKIFFTHSSGEEPPILRALDMRDPLEEPVNWLGEGFDPVAIRFFDIAFLRTQGAAGTDVYRYAGRRARIRQLTKGLRAYDLRPFATGASVAAAGSPTRLFVVRGDRDPEPLLEGENPLSLEGSDSHLEGFSVFVPDSR